MAADEGQRKVASILAADVAGYSRLMADDERATVRTLTAYREIFSGRVAAHQGRIVDTAGDSVLATFDSVVEAVEAAVEVQRDLGQRNEALSGHRKMQFRIGVNIGDIIVRDDGTIYGDGVNVAARLESLAEPGGIMLADVARQMVEGKLEVGLADAGEHEVKNIAKPILTWRVVEAGGNSQAYRRPRQWLWPALAISIAGVVAVLVGESLLSGRPTAPPPMLTADGTPTTDEILAMPQGPSIVVLPFAIIGDDLEQEFFADGITEEITAELSRFQDLLVIARTSAATYKGRSVDVREIGSELGVKYIVEGSIQRSGDTIRVSAQLLEAGDGTHVWAESYERQLTAGEIFSVQHDITSKIVGAIGDRHGAIARVARESLINKPTDNLTAYECVMRAYHYQDIHKAPQHRVARDCLEVAVELDPNYVDALAQLAYLYVEEYRHDFNPRPDPIGRAMRTVERALALDPNSQLGHWAKAIIHHAAGDKGMFLAEAERALELNPNDAMTALYMGHFMAPMGYWERGLALVDKAAALNPRGPYWQKSSSQWYHMYRQDFDTALDAVNRAGGDGYLDWMVRVSLLGHLGRIEEARSAISNLHRVYPDFTVGTGQQQAKKRNFVPELGTIFVEGLRKAGLPEATN